MDSEKPRALLSVWDKTGIVEFATSLAALGFELVSTGGTARMLKDAGLQVMSVSDVTQHPEIFDGRVKTLHPAIHGPLLARMQKEEDRLGMADLQYTPISLVACNLYPFVSAAAADPPLDKDALLEMIDIGGPTMVCGLQRKIMRTLSSAVIRMITIQLSKTLPRQKASLLAYR